jgi:hypothetical protein
MKGLENKTYLVAYIISNVLAIVLLLLAWKFPRVARLLFFILFAWAGWTNWGTAMHSPQDYLGYADLTFSEFYKKIILGWFSSHIVPVITFIATCQGLIAVALLLKGWIYKLALIGGITFLLGIVPFGVGSAFPATLIMAIALVLLWTQNAFLWKPQKHTYKIATE